MNRLLAGVLVILTVVAVAAGCASESKEKTLPDSKIANTADVYRQIVSYMQQTVNGLPWNAVLAAELPGLRTSRLGASPVPCDMDDSDLEQPYEWALVMWLLLPAGTDNVEARVEVAKVWDSLGWPVLDDGGDRFEVRTPDQFHLVSLINPTGEISISASAPCIPKSQVDRSQVWPETITKQDVT